MNYTIVITEKALKQLSEIPNIYAARITKRIDELAFNPFPKDSNKLQVIECYRIKIGDYRVIYSVDSNVLIIEIIRIKHRKDAYRL